MTPYIFRFHFAVGYTTDDSNNTTKFINLQSVTVWKPNQEKIHEKQAHQRLVSLFLTTYVLSKLGLPRLLQQCL
jgi:hypothetical protein